MRRDYEKKCVSFLIDLNTEFTIFRKELFVSWRVHLSLLLVRNSNILFLKSSL